MKANFSLMGGWQVMDDAKTSAEYSCLKKRGKRGSETGKLRAYVRTHKLTTWGGMREYERAAGGEHVRDDRAGGSECGLRVMCLFGSLEKPVCISCSVVSESLPIPWTIACQAPMFKKFSR